jgi:hypothetical protein
MVDSDAEFLSVFVEIIQDCHYFLQNLNILPSQSLQLVQPKPISKIKYQKLPECNYSIKKKSIKAILLFEIR